jgi:Ca-activated chloride channel family protein
MAAILLSFLVVVSTTGGVAAAEPEIGTGQLRVVGKDQKNVEVPLAHTSVQADVAGFIARVTVTQTFVNPFKEPIEAVYVFPLPHKAAVDDMTMKIGQRVIKGVIKKRDEAKQIYEDAKRAGKTASLLEQERPNIFTQSVANILPGDNIEIQISYVDVLKYENGEYEFVFPMVVGPRYIPGEQIIGQQGGGWAPDTNRVPDASRITPPVLKPGERSGHDIDVTLRLDAGVPFGDPQSPSHWLTLKRESSSKATINLDPRDTIPNKDFIVRYNVLGKAPQFGAVTYSEGNQGYFLLLLAPKAKYSTDEILPREILFVVDSSGSQSGDPLAKSKDVVKRALKGLRADDTFQVFNFNDIVTSMAPGPVPATAANINDAKRFIDQIQSTGGTRMLPAIQAALNWPPDPKRLRLVVMTTDGYIGNEAEIINEIHHHLGDARLFMFGCGSSTNRYLIDRMAEEGKGYATYLRQDEPAEQAITTLLNRLDTPVLRDVEIQWGGLQVADVYPAQIPDLFAGQPLVVFGRFTKPGGGQVRIAGKQGNGHTSFTHAITFPAKKSGADQLATLWARTRIEKFMNQLEFGGGERGKLEADVTDLGLRYRLMTQFTSFVAVEEQVRNVNGQMRTVQVPVEMPEGVSYEGVFGEAKEAEVMRNAATGSAMPMMAAPVAPPPPPGAKASAQKSVTGQGFGYGRVAGEEAADKRAGGVYVDPVAYLGITNQGPYQKALQQEIARALTDALKGRQLPTGKAMMIRLTLKSDGRVEKVELLKDELGHAEAARIVKDVLQKAKFPAPSQSATLVFFVHF